jgi:peptide/nickel transport system ATP-binding protein
MSLLTYHNLSVDYSTSQALIHAALGVTLEVAAGERLAVVGESGSGKTTIANAAIGLLPGSARVVQGQITFEGTQVARGAEPEQRDTSLGVGTRPSALVPRRSARPPSLAHGHHGTLSESRWRQIRGRRIGYIPQDPMLSLNPVRTIGKHLRDAILAQGLGTPSTWRELARERLAEAGLTTPDRVLGQYPHELSGGMRQRTLIALALLSRPPLIIADEPTSALDVIVQRQVLDHLESLIDRTAAALLLITHDVGLVADRTRRIIVMHNGRIVESGPTSEVLSWPQHPYTRRLLAAVPRLSVRPRPALAPAPPDEIPVLRTEQLTKVFHRRRRLGDLVAAIRPRSRWASAVEPPVEPLVDSSVGPAVGSAGDILAVDHIDLTIRLGECRALVGESGSGKSTVARLVVGLERATSGTLLISGTDRRQASATERRRLSETTQIVFQDPFASLDPQYSVRRILEEPLRVHRQLDEATRQQRVRDLLEQVQLPVDFATRFPSELSGGQRQRVAIARALALNPTLLVCDEAVSALDVLVQKQILDTLAELRHQLNLAVLFITHDLAVVAEIADTVSVINAGRIVDSGAVSEVFAHPNDPYTRELLDAIPGRALLLKEAS